MRAQKSFGVDPKVWDRDSNFRALTKSSGRSPNFDDLGIADRFHSERARGRVRGRGRLACRRRPRPGPGRDARLRGVCVCVFRFRLNTQPHLKRRAMTWRGGPRPLRNSRRESIRAGVSKSRSLFESLAERPVRRVPGTWGSARLDPIVLLLIIKPAPISFFGAHADRAGGGGTTRVMHPTKCEV